MTIEQKQGYIEVKASEGKALKYNDTIFHGGAFPLSFNIAQLDEIDEPEEKQEEEEEDE